MNQRHLLECKYLLGKNKIVSYITDYENLFQGDVEEQAYISMLLTENLFKLKAQIPM